MSWTGESHRHSLSTRGIRTTDKRVIRRIRDGCRVNIQDYVFQIKKLYELSKKDGLERAIRFDWDVNEDVVTANQCVGKECETVISLVGGEGRETIATLHTHPRGDAMPSLEDVYEDFLYFNNKGHCQYIVGKSVFDEGRTEVFGYRLNVRGKEGRRRYDSFLKTVRTGDEDRAYELMYRELITSETYREKGVPFQTYWLEVVNRFYLNGGTS